ncbi:MAG: AGE family epimerase/isomerase [Planctomycetia bacterium]|nr:AGE family epimerase/isomerase [Planctomycetia bacterium]
MGIKGFFPPTPLMAQEPFSLESLRQLDALIQSGVTPEDAAQRLVPDHGTETPDDTSDTDGSGNSPLYEPSCDLTVDSPVYQSPGAFRAFRWSVELRLSADAMATIDFPVVPDEDFPGIPGKDDGDDRNDQRDGAEVADLPEIPDFTSVTPRILGLEVIGGTLTEEGSTDRRGGLLRIADLGILPFPDESWHRLELVPDPGYCEVRFDGRVLLRELRDPGVCGVRLTCLDGMVQLRRIRMEPIPGIWSVDPLAGSSGVTLEMTSEMGTETGTSGNIPGGTSGLAGVCPSGTLPPSAAALADEIEAQMDRGLEQWYRNSVDRDRGGFHTNLDRQWDVAPYMAKGIVHQARMTWTAAEVARRCPRWRERLEPIAIHGGDFLRTRMWDARHGGFHWEVAADGAPLTSELRMKHSYGIAFGIYAMSSLYALTEREEDRDLAIAAFRWLEEHGHDMVHGGYREAFYEDGTPMTGPPAEAPWLVTGKVGEPLGSRSMNTHIHLLEAFTALYRIWPDVTLHDRLEELLILIRDRVTTSGSWGSAMRLYFDPDWSSAATVVSFGHDVETVFLLHEASIAVGRPDDSRTRRVMKGLMTHAIRWGWDEVHGGFHDEGATYTGVTKREKTWWSQAESLHSLLLMYVLHGAEDPDGYERFVHQWRFIHEHMIDAQYGGWYSEVDESGNLRGSPDKGNAWKTPYHETRAMLHVIELLRGSHTGNKSSEKSPPGETTASGEESDRGGIGSGVDP